MASIRSRRSLDCIAKEKCTVTLSFQTSPFKVSGHRVYFTNVEDIEFVLHKTYFWYTDKLEPELVKNCWTITDVLTGAALVQGVQRESRAALIERAQKLIDQYGREGVVQKQLDFCFSVNPFQKKGAS